MGAEWFTRACRPQVHLPRSGGMAQFNLEVPANGSPYTPEGAVKLVRDFEDSLCPLMMASGIRYVAGCDVASV